jgi:peptidoglycan/xylan/chitin deacetylase (PgdA/CDA1 family)
VLVCHADSALNRDGIARWLASFSDLAGIVAIEEKKAARTLTRVKYEIKRIGPLRFLDVLAFRLYYAACLARRDDAWQRQELAALARRYPDPPPTTEVLRTSDPNSPEAQAFIERLAPDVMLARCKHLLKARVFAIPRCGTLVLHPGICPEYRNAHGAFWALANRDLERVGLTLLKIDKGVDTGPVYEYYSYDFDEVGESHIVIMARLVLENLERIRKKLIEIHAGGAEPLDTTGRASAVWGQPWLTSYLRWKWHARWRRSQGLRPRSPDRALGCLPLSLGALRAPRTAMRDTTSTNSRNEPHSGPMHALSLEYHDVVDGGDFDVSGFPGAGPASYKLTRADFESHLDAIARRVRRSPSRAVDWLAATTTSRPLFLTFDDGGLGASMCIAEALERRGWRGHFLVTAQRIGSPTFLSAAHIRELHAGGHVIGTHSYSHPTRMGACSREQILEEWRRSAGILADILAEPVVVGSVPGGFYKRAVAEGAAQAGLRLLFTSAPTTGCWMVDGCLVVGRYTVRRWSSPSTVAALAVGSLRPRAAQWVVFRSMDLMRTIAGDHYTRLRERFWAARA